ncbi:MAG: RNB domain-containing ribonuclease [Deltaproteobacteria bacterium]|nr:RNB domain-containing ribonuclease [Deltaproteobacteria bacterium]
MLPVKGANNSKLSPELLKISVNSLVEYQQHGKSILGLAAAQLKDKWQVINEQGAEVYLPVARLCVLGQAEAADVSGPKRIEYLRQLSAAATKAKESINLEEYWELLNEEKKSVTEHDLAELVFTQLGAKEKLAVRRALLEDSVFFRRDKSSNYFEPRSNDVVEQLKAQAKVEQEKEKERTELMNAIISRIGGEKIKLPDTVEILEDLAVLGSKARQAKEAQGLLEKLFEANPALKSGGRAEEQALHLLVAAGHFRREENLALYRLGRRPYFTDALNDEATRLAENYQQLMKSDNAVDLTGLEVFSIDSASTDDIDDALSMEPLADGWRVGIHITAPGAVIEKSSPLFNELTYRASSIYCPDDHIPMLPAVLSEQMLSLTEGEENLAVSFFVDINRQKELSNRQLRYSKIKVKFRLNYEQVDAFLYEENPGAADWTKSLENSLLCLYEITAELELRRVDAGALQFSRKEMMAVIMDDGKIVLEPNSDHTPARKLVSELMILANETASMYARDNKVPFIYRSQEEPQFDPSEQALDIPEGPARDFLQRGGLKRSQASLDPLPHYGLGLQVYTQVTSPLRRASDFINQAQLIAHLKGRTYPFSEAELINLIARLEESLGEVNEVQRERSRYWLLKYLLQEKFTKISGVVLKTDSLRPLVELDTLFMIWPYDPLPQKRVKAYQVTTKPGERVNLNIVKIDPPSLTLRLQEV